MLVILLQLVYSVYKTITREASDAALAAGNDVTSGNITDTDGLRQTMITHRYKITF